MKTELDFENELLAYGTAKKKEDLLRRTRIHPNRIRNLAGKMGDPMPERLEDANDYAMKLAGFLLAHDGAVPEDADMDDLKADVFGWVCGEIWTSKHKRRAIQDMRCMVAIDLRKVFKDGMTEMAQKVGHMLKHNDRADLLEADRAQIKLVFMDAASEAAEQLFMDPAKRLGLLPPDGEEANDGARGADHRAA